MEQKENKKTIRVFAAASFLNDFGSDMIYPIWPLFVTTVFSTNMAVLGLIDGLGDAIVSISQAISGYLSDKIRRRKVFIWTGYFFGSASRIGYAFSDIWQHVVPFRVLDRAGKIRAAPRDAAIADLSTDENRGRNFGLLRTLDNLGALCGIIACIAFVWLFSLAQYKTLFLTAAIPSTIGALLILIMIKERKPSAARLYKGVSFKDLSRNFRLFTMLSAIFALGSFSYSFLLIFAENYGFSEAFVPILYLIFTASALLFSFPFGRLSDKIGRKTVLIVSYFLWGLVSLISILVQAYWAIILTFVLYGMHKGAIDTVQKAFVSELAPMEFRASSLGGFQLVVGICAFPSSLFAGLLWVSFGVFVPFYFSLAMTVLSALILVFVRENRGKS